MKIEKLYFYKKDDQWRGKPLYIKNEIDKNGLKVRFVDLKIKEGEINAFVADFKNEKGETFSIPCAVEDYSKNLVKLILPLSILSNKGKYEVVFSISFNSKDSNSELIKTSIQTFSVEDTIEINDEAIKQESKYPILTQLIDDLSRYKVNTSSLVSREQVDEMIMKSINYYHNNNSSTVQCDNNITQEYLNTLLSEYVKEKDMVSYCKTNELNNYVQKEDGKGLSTNDFTNELYKKVTESTTTNGSENNTIIVQYDDTKLLEQVKNDINETYTKSKSYIDEALKNLPIQDTVNIDLSSYLKSTDADNKYENKGFSYSRKEIEDTYMKKTDVISGFINDTYISKTLTYSNRELEDRFAIFEGKYAENNDDIGEVENRVTNNELDILVLKDLVDTLAKKIENIENNKLNG